MSRPVRVMQLIDSMAFGGAEVLLRDLTRGLLARGYQVSVKYSTPGPLAEDIQAMGVSTARFPRLGRIDPFLLMQMWRHIRREKPDIVHTHLFKSDFHGRLAARLAKVPVVISTLHNCDRWAQNPFFSRIYGFTARFARKIIAVSDEVREYAIAQNLSSPETLKTIPNAISIENFKRDEAVGAKIRSEFGISSTAPLLGIVARLSEQKDHANFLHAAALISQVQPQARFLIVGDGVLRQSLQELANSLGLGESVIFCGIRRDTQAIYSALDVLVFSSRWEGLPVVLLEGMAAGLPVVATDVGGIAGVLKDGETGYLVAPADPQALAAGCLKLIGNSVVRKKMGAAANHHIQAHYSMDAMVDSISELYQTLLKERSA